MDTQHVAPDEFDAQIGALSVDTNSASTLDATHTTTDPQESPQQHVDLDKKGTTSPPGLNNMPAELLFEIDGYLDKTSALSLRLASRRMKEVFTYTAKRNSAICTSERRELCGDLSLKTWLGLRIQAAKEDRVHSGLMQACVRCDAFHEINCFSAEQLQKPPMQRICLGHERVLHLCDHWHLNYFQLAKLPDGKHLQGTWYDWPDLFPNDDFRCHCPCLDLLSKLEKELPRPTSSLQARPGRKNTCIEVKSETTCDEWSISCGLDAEEAEERLLMCFDEDKWRMCPHMRAETLHKFDSEGAFSQLRGDGDFGVREGVIINGACQSPHCGAKLTLNWQIRDVSRENYYHDVQFEFSRHMEIFRMNGPEWLANTEVYTGWDQNVLL
ncbi:hypothetical protein BKA81DRAFT_395232 [Phyllosticta paracitricarpa]